MRKRVCNSRTRDLKKDCYECETSLSYKPKYEHSQPELHSKTLSQNIFLLKNILFGSIQVDCGTYTGSISFFGQTRVLEKICNGINFL